MMVTEGMGKHKSVQFICKKRNLENNRTFWASRNSRTEISGVPGCERGGFVRDCFCCSFRYPTTALLSLRLYLFVHLLGDFNTAGGTEGLE
jgi:hypothetical protein